MRKNILMGMLVTGMCSLFISGTALIAKADTQDFAPSSVEVSMKEGASIRYGEDGVYGIRFSTQISKTDYDNFVDPQNSDELKNVQMGMVIAPKDYHENAPLGWSSLFSSNDASYFFKWGNTTYGNGSKEILGKVVSINDTDIKIEKDKAVFSFAIASIQETNLERDFTSVGFVKYEYYDVEDNAWYTDYLFAENAQSRSAFKVAQNALASEDYDDVKISETAEKTVAETLYDMYVKKFVVELNNTNFETYFNKAETATVLSGYYKVTEDITSVGDSNGNENITLTGTLDLNGHKIGTAYDFIIDTIDGGIVRNGVVSAQIVNRSDVALAEYTKNDALIKNVVVSVDAVDLNQYYTAGFIYKISDKTTVEDCTFYLNLLSNNVGTTYTKIHAYNGNPLMGMVAYQIVESAGTDALQVKNFNAINVRDDMKVVYSQGGTYDDVHWYEDGLAFQQSEDYDEEGADKNFHKYCYVAPTFIETEQDWNNYFGKTDTGLHYFSYGYAVLKNDLTLGVSALGRFTANDSNCGIKYSIFDGNGYTVTVNKKQTEAMFYMFVNSVLKNVNIHAVAIDKATDGTTALSQDRATTAVVARAHQGAILSNVYVKSDFPTNTKQTANCGLLFAGTWAASAQLYMKNCVIESGMTETIWEGLSADAQPMYAIICGTELTNVNLANTYFITPCTSQRYFSAVETNDAKYTGVSHTSATNFGASTNYDNSTDFIKDCFKGYHSEVVGQ